MRDDYLPTPATLLQRLHFLLDRAVHTLSYSHDSKRPPEEKRDTGPEQGQQGVTRGWGSAV